MMRISSYSTFFLPFVVLLVPSLWMAMGLYDLVPFRLFEGEVVIISVLTAVIAAGLFFGWRKLVVRVNKIVFRLAIVLFPLLFNVLLALSRVHRVDFLSCVIMGGILYLAYVLLDRGYIARLTESSIEYENLLGQTGEIPLSSVSKLEQKRNLLSVFREFRILNMHRVMSVEFRDDALDEYEVNILTRMFRHRAIFDTIIERANRNGNDKIRQYVL